jgi:hypothetical protein
LFEHLFTSKFNLGENLPAKYYERGTEWIESKNPLYLMAQIKLSQADGQYYLSGMMCKDMIQGAKECKADIEIHKNQITAEEWWNELNLRKGLNLPVGLAQLARNLMLLPASTSGMERCFSTMGNIMSDRSCLGLDRASKLCAIYRTLQNNNVKQKD